MATARLKALQQLQSKMPAANQKVATGQQAARAMELQRAVAAAPAGAGVREAQQVGASQAKVAGEQSLGLQKTAQQREQQISALSLEEQQMEARRKQAGAARGLESRKQEINDRLAQLGEDVKNDVLDSRLTFQTDEAGRKYLNERKLADFAVLKAKSAEEFRDYSQSAQHAHRRKIQVMEAKQNKLMQVLQQGYVKDKGDLDKETRRGLVQMQRDYQEKIERAKAEAARKAQVWGTVGAIAGGAAGAFFGGPAGAAGGAKVGQSTGTAIGRST